jgi:hypothetical protein
MKRILAMNDERSVRDAVAALNEKILKVNRSNVSGPPTTQAVLDPEVVVRKWLESARS